MANRFKIDFYESSYRPFSLYFLEPGKMLRRDHWKHLECFPTREEALVFYEKIKDLPEYLP